LVIFLGDYFTSREGYTEVEQITNFKEIMEFKDNNPDKVILCLGNHDTQAMKYSWADCHPMFYNSWAYENRDEILKRCQWVHVIGNFVFSHAGISKTWFDASEFESVEDINKEIPTCKFGFTPCRWSDCTGTSETQPLTWIRPQTLIFNTLDNRVQVVGHTPVIQVCNITQEARLESDDELLEKLEGAPDVWCCDNLPKGYLIIEDKQFKPTKYERR
jgi:hypothetical protein